MHQVGAFDHIGNVFPTVEQHIGVHGQTAVLIGRQILALLGDEGKLGFVGLRQH